MIPLKDNRKNILITPDARQYLKAMAKIKNMKMVEWLELKLDEYVNNLNSIEKVVYEDQIKYLVQNDLSVTGQRKS